MDFSFDETQQAVRDLSKRILGELVTEESLRELEKGGESLHGRAWTELAKAGLLGVAVDDESGGMGMGMLEMCLVLQQVGRTVAPVPVLEAIVLGAMPIAAYGSDSR